MELAKVRSAVLKDWLDRAEGDDTLVPELLSDHLDQMTEAQVRSIYDDGPGYGAGRAAS